MSDRAKPCRKKMLETLITSKTRIKLLLKFFINPEAEGYLQGLAAEFNESTNAIRVELNRFEEAGLFNSESSGRRKLYKVNKNHPLVPEISSMVRKMVGIDTLIEKVISRIGELNEAYLIGDIARGYDSKILEVVLVGEKLNEKYIQSLVEKGRVILNKEIVISIESSIPKGHSILLWYRN